VLCLFVGGVPGTAEGRSAGERGEADLSVRIAASTRFAQPGRPLVYRVEVRNAGPGAAKLPTLRVRLPEAVQVLRVDVAECRPGPAAGEIVCPSRRNVLAGGSGSLEILGMVHPRAHGAPRAVATVAAAGPDGHPGNNVSESVIDVAEGADLAVRLVDGGWRPNGTGVENERGRRFSVAAVVRNGGPERVRNAHLEVRVPGARLAKDMGTPCRTRTDQAGRAGQVGQADPTGRPGRRGRVDQRPQRDGADRTGQTGQIDQTDIVGCRLRELAPGERVRLRLSFVAPDRSVIDVIAALYAARLGDHHPADNQARLRLVPYHLNVRAGSGAAAAGALVGDARVRPEAEPEPEPDSEPDSEPDGLNGEAEGKDDGRVGKEIDRKVGRKGDDGGISAGRAGPRWPRGGPERAGSRT
jgi:hypothetical protein